MKHVNILFLFRTTLALVADSSKMVMFQTCMTGRTLSGFVLFSIVSVAFHVASSCLPTVHVVDKLLVGVPVLLAQSFTVTI